MEYNDLLRKVSELEFVADAARADAMIKSVLGHLAGRMSVGQARQFVGDLPGPLDYDRLRGHQARPTAITVRRFFDDIREQFHLSGGQAHDLVRTILDEARSGIPSERIHTWEEGLPADWGELIRGTISEHCGCGRASAAKERLRTDSQRDRSCARLLSLAAVTVIGDGLMGLLYPRSYVRVWMFGPGIYRRIMRTFLRRPFLTRLLGAGETGFGIWLGSRLWGSGRGR